MAIKITEKRKKELLTNFIENPTFYKFREFEKIRDIIAIDYRYDYNILEKITANEKSRKLLSSTKLLQTIIVDFSKGIFEFTSDTKSDDFFFFLSQFNLHEEEYFSNNFKTSSLEFLTYVIPIIDAEIINTEKVVSYEKKIISLHSFFKRIIDNVTLQKTDQVKYQNLFNKLEQLFLFNNYKNASTWFKFYFYYRDKGKFPNGIEGNVKTNVSTFVIRIQDSKSLRKIIEDTIPVKEFLSLNKQYLDAIYQKCTDSNDFTIEFYSFFEEVRKQSLLEFWISKTSNELNEILESIKGEIPDYKNFAVKIIHRTKSLNNNLREKGNFFNILNSLNLSKEELSNIGFTKQIERLIFTNDIKIHEFGILQLQKYRESIDTKSLKSEAEKFMSSILTDPNTFNLQIQNIIDSRLGITTNFIDSFINSNSAYLNRIPQYLVDTGNLNFFISISSKLKEFTVIIIVNNFINRINKEQKYLELVNFIMKNYYDLLDNNAKSKIETLINN